MRDLYALLGLRSPKVSKEQIRSAIKDRSLSAADRRDVEAVLLIEDRRRPYDHAWKLLHRIGQMRSNLGLSRGECWTAPAFNVPAGTTSEIDLLARNGLTESMRTRRQAPAAFRAFRQLLGLITVLVAVVWISGSLSPDRETTPPRGTPEEVVTKSTFNASPRELPTSGIVDIGAGPRLAPFTLVTRGDNHYYLRLVDPNTSQMVLEVFVRSGDRLEVKAPLGTFEMRYAAGSDWYGFKHLFGPDTYYGKADILLEFSQAGRRVSGHTIELYMQEDGNLPTRSIDAGSFY